MPKPRSMKNHRDDIPGLEDNAVWCNNCATRCGGDGPRCLCCGGSPKDQPQQSDVHYNRIDETSPPGVQQPQPEPERKSKRKT